MSATIVFKAKPIQFKDYNPERIVNAVRIPSITRSHCDLNAFRSHPKYGSYANSTLFLSLINRDLNHFNGIIEIDNLPENITIKKGFLNIVTITL